MSSSPRGLHRLVSVARHLFGSHPRVARLTALAAFVLGLVAIGGAGRAVQRAEADFSYITELKVVSGWSSSVSCGDGWTKMGTDLNKGAGGKYIYACVKYGTFGQGNWNFIYAVGGSTRDVACKSSTHKKIDGPNNYGLDGNLNAGAGGQYIFFCMRPLDPYATGEPERVTNISFIVISGSTPEWMAKSSAQTYCFLQGNGWKTNLDLKDLNDTVGGAYIYTCNHLDARAT